MSLECSTWRKSSYSSATGSGNCVEVAHVPLADPVWRKSSYSATSSGNCVEIAFGGTVAVRDSKNPAGPILSVSEATWRAFLSDPSPRDPA
jgi:Domain of unknown function (DUF397)